MATQPTQPVQPMDTTSLDLPPALESLLNMGAVQQPAPPPSVGLSGAMGAPASQMSPLTQPLPAYQDGGAVGPGGQPLPMQGNFLPTAPASGPGLAAPGAQQNATPQQIMQEAQRFARQHPEQVQQIQQAIQQAMQSGELTPQELNMIVQMATVALQNPDMYQQLRSVAIQQGLAAEQDISPQFDPGLLFTIVVVGQVMQGGQQPAPAGMPQGVQPTQQNMPSMEKGGELPAKSEPVPIMAHTGEYVIPAEVVRAKGTEFFDSLVSKYRGGNGAS